MNIWNWTGPINKASDRKEFSKAIALCDECLSLATGDTDDIGIIYFLKGLTYYQMKEDINAIACFDEALSHNNYATFFDMKAHSMLRLGKNIGPLLCEAAKILDPEEYNSMDIFNLVS